MQPLKVFTHNEIKTILNLPTWQFYYAIQPVFDNKGRIRLLLGYQKDMSKSNNGPISREIGCVKWVVNRV